MLLASSSSSSSSTSKLLVDFVSLSTPKSLALSVVVVVVSNAPPLSCHLSDSRHINTSAPEEFKTFAGVAVFLRGVFGTPCGQCVLELLMDTGMDLVSSSKVTIFSLGFMTICICGGGGGGARVVQSKVCGGPSCRPCGKPMPPPCCTVGEQRLGGGKAKSPTPDKLNSLMLRGTK